MNRIVMKRTGIVLDDGLRDNLLDGSCFLSNSISGAELKTDTLNATMTVMALLPTLLRPTDAPAFRTSDEKFLAVYPRVMVKVIDPSLFAYGDEVEYYHDDVLIGLFYMENLKQLTPTTWEISCVSAVGLLENQKHYGGIYTGQTFEQVAADIIGGAVSYVIDQELRSIAVYGWLPIATRRSNLQQLLFAEGISLKKTSEGQLWFTALSDSAPVYIPEERLYMNGDIDFGSPATLVTVTEHTYTVYSTDPETVLFEGEAVADTFTTPKGAVVSGVLVTFESPMHNLSITSATILESGVNYAVISGSSGCRLVGKAYTHTTRVLTRGSAPKSRELVNQKDNEVSVTEATLVSLVNSENVADRMMNYYGKARSVNNGVVVQGERPGDAVSFTTPFGEAASGFIESFNITMSKILKAVGTMIVDYVPSSPGNYYSHFAVLTTDQTWTVPAEAKDKIRAVLIGGAKGGWSGCKGERGGGATSSSYGSPGKGGLPGQGADGGNIFNVTIPVTKNQTFVVRLGKGGAGGVMNADGTSGEGQAGGATTFGSYSSASGVPSDTGFVNTMSGVYYALPGKAGIAGGEAQHKDESRPSITYKGMQYLAGNGPGEMDSSHGQRAYGSLGSGAAAGVHGLDGLDGQADDNNGHGFARGADGPKGAKPVAADPASGIACGGNGGHGGGGGGGGGPATGDQQYTWSGSGGDGGDGGDGSPGTDGCVIVFW